MTLTRQFYNNLEKRITLLYPTLTGNGGSPGMLGSGDSISEAGTSNSGIADSHGVRMKYSTGASSGAKAAIFGDLIYRRDLDAEIYCKFLLEQTNACRIFIGFTDQPFSTMASQDNPSGNYFGIQYSTPRGDASFKRVSKDGSNQSISDYAVVDIDAHDLYLRMFRGSGNDACQIQMDDNDPVDIVTRIPGNSVNMRFVATIEAEAAAVKVLDIGKVLIGQTA